MMATIEELEGRIKKVGREIRADRDRAAVAHRREVDTVDYDITILEAEKTRLAELAQVRAPFAGKIVYRHPAPGLASGNSPILAISTGTGFTAAIRLPRDELHELSAQNDAVKLALDSPVLNQFFTGRFVRSEPVPFEPGRLIAYFDCNLPPEIIGYLGNTADRLRVRLLWRPSLLFQPGVALGTLLLAVSALFWVAAVHNVVRTSRYRLHGQRATQSAGIKMSERARGFPTSPALTHSKLTARESPQPPPLATLGRL